MAAVSSGVAGRLPPPQGMGTPGGTGAGGWLAATALARCSSITRCTRAVKAPASESLREGDRWVRSGGARGPTLPPAALPRATSRHTGSSGSLASLPDPMWLLLPGREWREARLEEGPAARPRPRAPCPAPGPAPLPVLR